MEGDKQLVGSYIWHTAEAPGRNYDQFKSAQLIASSKMLDKVIFLMDRGEQALSREYHGFADENEGIQATES